MAPKTGLSECALRGLLGPLGIGRIQIDPVLIVADISQPTQVRNVPTPSPHRSGGEQMTGRQQAVAEIVAGVADVPLGATRWDLLPRGTGSALEPVARTGCDRGLLR
jgi:hypothetical protein